LWTGWSAAALFLLLGGAVRVARLWGDFATWAHWDDVRNAVPAAQILDGTFPVHQIGVEYYGAAPAYVLAAWFAPFGTSTVALDLFCLLLAGAIAWTGYLIACRLLPRWPAFLAGLVLAVPPLVFARWVMSANLNYPLNQLIGNALLLGTHTIFYRRSDHGVRLFVLGLLAGIGWWNNPMVVVYCAPFAVLALRTGLVWRARFWLFGLGVLLGGLPDWIYEIVSYPSSRIILYGAGGVTPTTPLERVVIFLRDVAPELVGARSVDLATIRFVPSAAAQATLAGFGLLAVGRALVRDRDELRWLVGAGGSRGTGLAALWALVAANLAITLLTRRALAITYFLPLYAVLPLWYGEFLAWLWGVRRALGVAGLVGVLGFYLWSSWAVTLGRGAEAAPRWSGLHALARPVAEWLEMRGIRHVYFLGEGFLPSFEFTFLTGMRIVAAHPWHEPVVQHGQAVDAELAPPVVADPSQAAMLHATLRGLGQSIRQTRVGAFIVLEANPASPRGFAPIAPSAWRVSASHREFDVGHVIDRDAATGWSTGRWQAPGQWLSVDLGAEEDVARVDLLAIDWQEVPAGLRVELSRDGQSWQEAVSIRPYWGPMFVSEYHPFLRVRRGRVQAVFHPARARFLRLTQTGSSTGHAWAARELFVYRPAAAPHRAPPRDGELVPALRGEGIRMVYASHWLSARVLAEGGGAVSALDSNLYLNSYRHTIPEPHTLERFRMLTGRAVLLGSDSDAAGIRKVLETRGALARVTPAGPYQVLHLAPPEAPRRLERDGWRATASRASADASRVLDGDRRTRWTAEGPVETVEFALELGRARRVAGLRMRPGSREGGPADFQVEGSADGVKWERLGPFRWGGPLYWTGYELLRNGRVEWTVRFPPVTVRHLRIRPTAPGRSWAIEEIDAFE
jgi:hypothetical protein